MKKLKELIEMEKPPTIISVGDVVSENMIKHGIRPEVLIVDNRVMRESIKPIHTDVNQTLHVKNPPGTLTDETWAAMQKAIQGKRTKILVDGEEDLLTLAAALCAPENSFVVYGQPHEGIVVIKVTEEKKTTIRGIVEAMKPTASKD
jgi:uncharacterized protein (UPF0218 family)